MGRGGKNDKINIEDRRAQALELRKGGSSYRAIAKKLNTDVSTAHSDVNTALKELVTMNTASAGELREIELERLDAMLLSISTGLKAGHLGAIDRALRIGERRAKLLGLDAPVKIQELDWRDDVVAGLRANTLTYPDVLYITGGDNAQAAEIYARAGLSLPANVGATITVDAEGE